MNTKKFTTVVSILKEYFKQQAQQFEAGCISKQLHCWGILTSDAEILATVSGLPIEFDDSDPPNLKSTGNQISSNEVVYLNVELTKLLGKKVFLYY